MGATLPTQYDHPNRMNGSQSNDNSIVLAEKGNEETKPLRHRPFGVTSRDEKRQRRTGSKKAQRADRKVAAMRQEMLAASIEKLCEHIRDELAMPNAESRSGVQRTMHEIGKWTKKLLAQPGLLHGREGHRISSKGLAALKLVGGHSAERDYRKGRIDAKLVFHHFAALRAANEEIRLLYNPGKKLPSKKSRRTRNKRRAVTAKPLLIDIGSNRSPESTLSGIHQYLSRYCKRPPPNQLEELEDHLSRLLGCRNVTRKRQTGGRVPVGKNEKHQSLSAMMLDAAYSAVYEFLAENANVNLTNGDSFFAKRRQYHLSRARRKGEEHHTT